MPEIIPPQVEVLGFKRFDNMFDCMKHVYSEIQSDRYNAEHGQTRDFIRRHLTPLV